MTDERFHRVGAHDNDKTVVATTSDERGWSVQAYRGEFVDISVWNAGGHRAVLRVPADVIDDAVTALHRCYRAVAS
jgi:hypothetical protein